MPSGGVTTTHKNPPAGRPRKPVKKAWDRKRIAAVAVGAILLVFLIGWAGYGIHAATHPAKSVTTERTLTGTVTLVGNNGTSGCVKPDGGGSLVCTVFYMEPGNILHTGDRVHAAHQHVETGNGGYDLLLIYSPNP